MNILKGRKLADAKLRRDTLEKWQREGKLDFHFNGGGVAKIHIGRGDKFTSLPLDYTLPFPSEQLFARIALAIQAGAYSGTD